MRTFFILSLATTILLIPSSNGCVHGNGNVVNIVKAECDGIKLIKSTNLPNLPASVEVVSRCDDYLFKEKELSKALEIFVLEYSENFGLDPAILWSYLDGIKIELSIIPRVVKAAYSVDGKFIKGSVPVTGLALGPKHIWVEIKTSQIWSSSLVHELVHAVIWNENSGIHGDPDHEGKEFSGWTKKHTKFIKDLNIQLLDLGI